MTVHGGISDFSVEDEVCSVSLSLSQQIHTSDKARDLASRQDNDVHTYVLENCLYTQELIMLHQISLMIYLFL